MPWSWGRVLGLFQKGTLPNCRTRALMCSVQSGCPKGGLFFNGQGKKNPSNFPFATTVLIAEVPMWYTTWSGRDYIGWVRACPIYVIRPPRGCYGQPVQHNGIVVSGYPKCFLRCMPPQDSSPHPSFGRQIPAIKKDVCSEGITWETHGWQGTKGWVIQKPI